MSKKRFKYKGGTADWLQRITTGVNEIIRAFFLVEHSYTENKIRSAESTKKKKKCRQ